jgi:uncharacterized glyoxalase superfamily protein PhnB
MARGLAGVLLVALALAAPAAGADTIIGTGTSAWGEPFSLSVSTERAAGKTMRCLAYRGSDSEGSNCPLTRPTPDAVETEGSVNCQRKRGTLYGAIDARVARVVVRLVGGRVIEATRFEPVPAVDPQMAYWIASFKGTTAVRSVTTVAADGSVLARNRDPGTSSCAEERQFNGRRYPVGMVTDAAGHSWRLEAYRGLERDDEEGLVRTLCFSLTPAAPGRGLGGDSIICGLELTPDAKALAINADDLGCEANVNLILYGVARPKVARIVFRSRAGVTVAVPKRMPRALHAGGRLWMAAIHVPASGFVIDAQDRRGRTIAKERLKPHKIPGVTDCALSGGFGTL